MAFLIHKIFFTYAKTQNIEQNLEIHRPLSFNLQTLAQFYSSNTSNTSFTIDRKYVNDIESYLSSLSVRRNTLEKILSDLSENLQDNLTEQFNYINKRSSQLNNYYLTEVKILKDEVIAIRNGQHSLDNLQKLLNKVDKESLKIELNDLLTDAVSLKEKNKLVVYLQQKQITYLNVKYIDIAQDDPFPVVEQKLLRNEPNSQIFCTNDHLQKNEKRRWDEMFPQFIEQRKKLPNLHLIYADFTYSTYELQGSKIIYSKQSLKTSPEPPSLKDDSTIKLLLYGESGVGKSTFINAFANYLQFESIEQARLGKALVLIPVSFLITINDQFEERLIEFGHDDANENHNDQGQSVTQHCKSYEFHLLNGQKLEIIDTPGFGDTRGQNQDDENLRGIFSYLDNVSHLNALCILLKPNVNKLNPTFRSSLMQILDFFGNDFHPNIFFCFTNCQSTFFSIGDTGPILRKFLQRYPEKKINLKKENTFCFDSESFRYLVASGRSIQFDQQFIEQFQSSWKRSVEESNRFIDKICSKERQLHIDGTWISMEEIKREINDLHRPMLETIRNLIRNMILSAEGFCIQLKPSVILSSMYLCYKLNRICQDFKGINIMLDNIHPSSDQCESEHLMTNYRLIMN
ncbi:hypothetical protein I4U23_023181 [Adineta vaga]|nr:hypothetical protein I4U23_023181 [Adineta vaga]